MRDLTEEELLFCAFMTFATVVTVFMFCIVSGMAEASEHECGHGPVNVKIQIPTPCENATTCSLHLSFNDTYVERCVTYSVACYETIEEEWTDWPECDGAEKLMLIQ